MDILIKFLFYFIYFLSLILIFGLIDALIERRSTIQIYSTFGKMGIMIGSISGTFIHELGHAFFAIITGSNIVEVKLIPKYRDIGSGEPLGYVKYTYKQNIWGSVSSFFIGIGPMFSGPLAILILMKLLIPNTYQILYNVIIETMKNQPGIIESIILIISGFFKGILTFETFTDFRLYIFILLATSIASHITLSKADMKVAFKGFIYLIVVVFTFGIILLFLGTLSISIVNAFQIFVSFMSILFIISFIFTVLNFIISYFFWRILT